MGISKQILISLLKNWKEQAPSSNNLRDSAKCKPTQPIQHGSHIPSCTVPWWAVLRHVDQFYGGTITDMGGVHAQTCTVGCVSSEAEVGILTPRRSASVGEQKYFTLLFREF